MKDLYIIIFAIFFVFSCDGRKNEEVYEPENIYDKTKAFKTNFKFIVDEQDKNIDRYWFNIRNLHKGICCVIKSASGGIHGGENLSSPPYRKNTEVLDTVENYLDDKFIITIIVTDKVKRSPYELRQRIYESDTLRFKSIKDSLRIIRYPQDTLNLIKRYYPPGHPKYKKP